MLSLMTQTGFLTDLSGTIKSARRELESTFTSVSENTLPAKAAQYRADTMSLFREHHDRRLHKVLEFLVVVDCLVFIQVLWKYLYSLLTLGNWKCR